MISQALVQYPRGILRVAADVRGALGLLAAVACLGAGGGLLSPGTKSRMGISLCRTPFRSASTRPSSSGIQVPGSQCQLPIHELMATAIP